MATSQTSLIKNPPAIGFAVNAEMRIKTDEIISNGIVDKAAKIICSELIVEFAKRLKLIRDLKAEHRKKINEATEIIEAPFNQAFNEISALKEELDAAFKKFDEKERLEDQAKLQKSIDEENARKAAEQVAAAEQAELEKEADILAPIEDEPAEPIHREIPMQAETKQEPVRPAAPQINLKSEPTRTAGGTVTVVRTWQVEILDPEKIPVKYKVPSETLLMDAFKAGVTSIDGVRFYEKLTPKPYYKRK
jgi:hypothetical protein